MLTNSQGQVINITESKRFSTYWNGFEITKTDAHAILDQVKMGLPVPQRLINIALHVTGDL